MRYLFVLIMSVLTYQTSHSQIYEIGAFIGGSNIVGDVGNTNFISPNQTAFGALLKWNRSPRHSWRLSFIFTDIEAQDSRSNDPRRVERDLSFDQGIFEVSGGLEYTFFDFNLHDGKTKYSPYLYSGISATNFNDFHFDNGVLIDQNSSSWVVAIPITLGIKGTFGRNIIIAAEVGARFAFTDALDGSEPTDNALEEFEFGNINNNDWYVFSGITLTYTFGRKPCYCNN